MANAVILIGMAADILGGIIALQGELNKISELIKKAQAENRDVTTEELEALRQERLSAREKAKNA